MQQFIETEAQQPQSVPRSGVRIPLIKLRGVVKIYKNAATDFKALKEINIDIFPGEFVGIIGKSGAGKTTLVNMITGMDHLTGGSVEIDGVSVHSMNESAMAFWRGRTLGVIYQNFQLMPTLTLVDNIMLPMDFCGLYRGRRSVERALDLLRMVELEEHANKLPSTISGGQQQRVAIARALANDCPIIVADEPTGRLDSVTSDTIFQIFLNLIKAGKTLVMVTHDESLASQVSRIIHLSDGEIISDSKDIEP
jgi:putative ABC transport system ATP-binding protein